MEKQLSQILQKCENAESFDKALSAFMEKMPQLVPMQFDKVFPKETHPNSLRHLIRSVVEMQITKRFSPSRDISINTDCTKFQIIDLAMHEVVIKMKKALPPIK